MAESGAVLKIAELFQELRNLDDNVEHIFRRGMVSNIENFQAFVQLDRGIKSFLVEFLPISAEFKLGVVIIDHEKLFDVGDFVFQLQELVALFVVEGNLL